MKSILLIVACLVALASAQYRTEPRNAAILQEARYLSGDGSFGAAYVNDDGSEFKEETDSSGNRKGQYSYVDPNGKKITVQYTAGKDGFKVTGDHLPVAPQPLPVPQQAAPKQPQYNAGPQYNSIQQQQQPRYNNVQQQNQQANGQFSYSFGGNAQQPQQQQYNNGQYDNGQYDNGQQYNNNGQYNNGQQYNNNGFQQQAFQTTTTTTPAPRFFPPGKLNLNRTPDGYQYSFSSN